MKLLDSFEALDPGFLADPRPVYAELRAAGRPIWNADIGAWVAARHADVVAILRDPRFRNDPRGGDRAGIWAPMRVSKVSSDFVANALLFMDPPDHTRIRRLVSKAFSPRVTEALRPVLRVAVDDTIAGLDERETVDVIDAVAAPSTAMALATLLGIPDEGHDVLRSCAPRLAALADWDAQPEDLLDIGHAGLELSTYLLRLFRHRRRRPRNDLISALVAAQDGGDRLSHDEMLTTAMVLAVVGFDTTVSLIGNAVLALAARPDHVAELRADPSVLDTGVDELARFDAVVRLTVRRAAEDAVVSGVRIGAGESVLAVLGAANHDPEAFDRPDVLDLRRGAGPGLAFGHGMHFCLGAAVARTLARLLLEALFVRFDVEIDRGGVEYRRTAMFHGPRHLPVQLSATRKGATCTSIKASV